MIYAATMLLFYFYRVCCFVFFSQWITLKFPMNGLFEEGVLIRVVEFLLVFWT